MISLRTYLLGGTERDSESSYRRMIDLFLQAISLHAVEGAEADYQQFRSDMNAFALRLAPEISISERFLLIGEVLRALQDYNRHTTRFLRVQNSELQRMITMLTQTMIAVGASSDTSLVGLQEIEKALEKTRMVEDIQLVRAQLGECLKSVRGEAQRQKTSGKAALENIPPELAESLLLRGVSMGLIPDPVTGLPGKAQAEKGLQGATASPGTKFLLLAVIDRLPAVNARFGNAIGDQVLAVSAAHFRGALPAEDILYRWEGPALLAVLNRTGTIDSVRAEVRRFADKKLEKNFLIGLRSVLLPISTNWTIFPIVPPLEALLRKVEIFMATQLSHDNV
jgi:GGDEF domain-containing protein